MPQVPRYESRDAGARAVNVRPEGVVYDTRESGIASTQALQRGVEGLLGGAAKGAEAVAAGIERQHEEERQKAQSVALQGALNAYQQHGTTSLYDSKSGFLNQQGQAAVQRSPELYEALKKKRKEIAQGLPEDVRQMFDLKASQYDMEVQRLAEHHVAGEIDRVAKDTFAAGVETNLQSLAMAPLDPKVRQRTAQESTNLVLAEAKRQGLSPEATQKMVKEHEGRLTSTVLDSLIASKDTGAAREFFFANKEKLGPKAAKYEATVREMGLRADADNVAVGLMKEATDPETGWVDEDYVFAEIDNRDVPPDVKAAARDNLKDRIHTARAAKNTTIDKHYRKAAETFLQTGNLGRVDPSTKTFLQRYAPDEWHKLEGWANQRRADREARRSNGPTEAQTAAKWALKADMLANPDKYKGMEPDAFLRKYGAALGDKNYGDVFGDFEGIKKSKTGDATDLPSNGMKSIIADGRAAGIFPADENDVSKWSPRQVAAFGRVMEKVKENEAVAKAAGKEPTVEDYRAWAAPHLVKVTLKTKWYQSDKTVTRAEAETNPELEEHLRRTLSEWGPEPEPGTKPTPKPAVGASKAVASSADVPTPDVAAIKDSYRRKFGRNPTSAEIADAYNRKISRGR